MSDATVEFGAWITKYALSTGVFTVRGTLYKSDRETSKPTLSLCDADRNKLRTNLFFYGHWHLTKEAAEARVKAMVRARKAAMMREQVKLDAILDGLNAGSLPMAKGYT